MRASKYALAFVVCGLAMLIGMLAFQPPQKPAVPHVVTMTLVFVMRDDTMDSDALVATKWKTVADCVADQELVGTGYLEAMGPDKVKAIKFFCDERVDPRYTTEQAIKKMLADPRPPGSRVSFPGAPNSLSTWQGAPHQIAFIPVADTAIPAGNSTRFFCFAEETMNSIADKLKDVDAIDDFVKPFIDKGECVLLPFDLPVMTATSKGKVFKGPNANIQVIGIPPDGAGHSLYIMLPSNWETEGTI